MIGEIVGIRKVPCDDEFVYNIEVEAEDVNNKNFFADEILVSNCHGASSDAEEALLRLIEEPPSHVCFILCTTELHKMRDTIVSRCQTHNFQKVYWSQLTEHLKTIAEKEKLNINEAVLKICAIAANGSVRNSLQCLEKLIGYAGGEEITVDLARRELGVVGHDVFFDLMSCICNEMNRPNPLKGYRIINSLLAQGVSVSAFLQGLDEHLRAVMIALTAQDAMDFLELADEDIKRINVEASRFTIKKISKILTQLNEVYRCMNYGIPLERLLDQWFVKSVLICHLAKKIKEGESNNA